MLPSQGNSIFVGNDLVQRLRQACLWRQEPDEADLKDPGLEVVLPEAATPSDVAPALLLHGVLPDLWAGPELRVKDLRSYFSGD
jgi:hypothetical protein